MNEDTFETQTTKDICEKDRPQSSDMVLLELNVERLSNKIDELVDHLNDTWCHIKFKTFESKELVKEDTDKSVTSNRIVSLNETVQNAKNQIDLCFKGSSTIRSVFD